MPAPLTKVLAAGISHRYPEFIPGGRRFLFESNGGQPETDGIYAGVLDGAPPVRILPDLSHAVYAPPSGGGPHGLSSVPARDHVDGSAVRSR